MTTFNEKIETLIAKGYSREFIIKRIQFLDQLLDGTYFKTKKQ